MMSLWFNLLIIVIIVGLKCMPKSKMMGFIILRAFDDYYGIVFIAMILYLPCDMHARLKKGVRTMVELRNNNK